MRQSRFVLLLMFGVLLASSTPVRSFAQDEPKPIAPGEWRREGKLGVNLLQSYYTEHWKGGDKGSVVWAATLDYRSEKQFDAHWNWRSDLNLAFGQTHQQERDGEGNLSWQKPDKTTDRVKFENLLRYGLSGWDPFFAVGVESQFLDESDPFGRRLTFNPLVTSQAIGISHPLINQGDRQLLSRLGFALRQNNRKVFATADPTDESTDKLTSNDGGLELVLDYTDKILQDRVQYTSKFTAYKAMYYSAKSDLDDVTADELTTLLLPTDVADYSLATDLDWENTFVTAITKLINVQFYLRWSYDKYDNSVKPVVDGGTVTNPGAVDAAIRKAGQLKQTMAIGLAYAF
jgi:hypothetical protein